MSAKSSVRVPDLADCDRIWWPGHQLGTCKVRHTDR